MFEPTVWHSADIQPLSDDTSTTATTESETTVESTSAETSTAAQTSQSTAATETSQSTAAAQTSQSTAAAQTSQSTAAAAVTTSAGASGVMTEELRQMVVDTHNTDRSLVAQGAVRNGKPGNANLGPAIDMLRMRYDTALETEAQAYADTCALKKSEVSTRPDSGENTHVIQSSTVTVSDALTKSMQTWWNQILSNGVNAKLHYTATLDTKSNAPLGFTQGGFKKSPEPLKLEQKIRLNRHLRWPGLPRTRSDVVLAVVPLPPS
ncbi:SCP-like protein [Necator americanus]|uniref:SCP-like protein n=1 Tax=Necator americanus TaxID=51031 RepID=W2TX36_NECAM|nr:SCP-like protein [Necator americanus]ETN86239.1 SCP-like protein [Necator americanus]